MTDPRLVYKRKDELLQNIAAGINALDTRRPIPLGCIEVVFHVGKKHYTFGLAQALDTLANDLTWDERGNWSDAERATVNTI